MLYGLYVISASCVFMDGDTVRHESFEAAVFMLFHMATKFFYMKVQDGAVQIWI